MQEFNSRVANPITLAIYSILTIDIYTESFALLLITKLRNYYIILGRPLIKKHKVIINMTNNF